MCGILGCVYEASQRIEANRVKALLKCPLPYLDKNVPFFCFLPLFCFLWLFSQKISLQDASGTTILFSVDLRDPGFSDPLAWPGAPPCVARRAERFRAKRRARPTTAAVSWPLASWLASAPSGGTVHATDGWAAASPSASSPKSAPVGSPGGLLSPDPAAVLSRQSPASATHALQTRCSSCRTACAYRNLRAI